MSERTAAIAADVAHARERLLAEGTAPAGGLRIRCLELDEDSVSFEVDGFDGEFTAFLADPYPAGETAIYGPDDLELQHSGSVAAVLEGVLQDLQKRLERRSRARGGKGSGEADGGGLGAQARAAEGEEENGDDGETGSAPSVLALDRNTSAVTAISSLSPGGHDADPHWLLEEQPMEPRLERDLSLAKEVLGACAVDVVQLSVDAWRVRLQVDVATAAGGEALVDATTANAWGLNPVLPITVELHVPITGYMEASMNHRGFVHSVWQEGFPKFTLGKQLAQILADFAGSTLGQALEMPRTDGYSEEELESVHAYFLKKVELISQAQVAELGFFVHLVRYAQLRIPTLHEYCAICDQPFMLGPMFLRTVCSQELCIYQYAEFGSKITTAEGVNTQAEIVDLLVCMLMRAVKSSRREMILEPYPCVYGTDGKDMIFSPKSKEFDKLSKTVETLEALRNECALKMGAAWSTLTCRMGEAGAALVKWVVASNRSFLAPLQDDHRIAAFRTPFQYLLISAPPDKEKAFQALKARHGSSFAYHGSPAENWHSILRNGLKNASNTRLMTSGAAHGPGIYLATDSGTSMAYATGHRGMPQMPSSGGTDPPQLKRQKTGNRFVERAESLVMLAVCEVINDPSVHKHGSVWVAPREETVCTRFFLVFTGGAAQEQATRNVPIASLANDIKACMEQMRVGVAASRS